MNALSLAALTVLELSPVEMVRCAAATGYAHVGLRLLPATPHEPVWDAAGDTPLVRELRHVLAGSGVGVLDIEILRLTPGVDVRGFLPVLETGAALGARFVLVAGNDADEARLTDRFGLLCDLAAPFALSPYLEPMPWTDLRDVVHAARIVEAAGRANAGVLVDPIHFDRAGSTFAQLASIAPQRLAYMQFCDAPAERPTSVDELLRQARGNRLLPGDGGLGLRELLRAMPLDLPLSLEIPLARPAGLPARERARRAMDATRRLLESIAD